MAACVLYVGVTQYGAQQRYDTKQAQRKQTTCKTFFFMRRGRRRRVSSSIRFHIGITCSPAATYRLLKSKFHNHLRTFIILSYPLPLHRAERALALLRSVSWEKWSGAIAYSMLRFFARRVLASVGEKGCWRPWRQVEYDETFPDRDELTFAAQAIAGRVMLHHEFIRMLAQEGEGIVTTSAEHIIEHLVADGRMKRRSALYETETGQWYCRRCMTSGEVSIGPCSRCQREMCASCLRCAPFGIARACEALYTGAPLHRLYSGHNTSAGLFRLRHEFSKAQARAAASLRDNSYKRALVWAACGAGKTEVVFPVIERNLMQGIPVLFAVPRRDIAAELGERLADAFPSVSMHVLYGGAPQRYETAQLTVATTHQVLRFAQRFPFIIIDEVDAFPYHGNTMLRRAVGRAATADGRFIYMTATPSDTMLQLARRHNWHMVTIPARYHGHPLPEPQIHLITTLNRVRQQIESYAENIRQSDELAAHIVQMAEKENPHLVFVPTVRLVDATTNYINRVYQRMTNSSFRVARGTHAGDENRSTVRKAFERGEFPILVATTVFERGITIPNVHVTVLWADDERVFHSATLIQMAGRVGRTARYPTGNVHFLSTRLNAAMRSAIQNIQHLNNEARRNGFLHTDAADEFHLSSRSGK